MSVVRGKKTVFCEGKDSSLDYSLLNKVIVIGLIFLLCACHTTHRTGEVLLPVPETFSRTGTADLNKRWWESFHDPDLNQLVEQMFSQNLSLKQAWARLAQTRSLADQARASRWPWFTSEAGAARSRTNIPASTGTVAAYGNQYTISLGASYEVDLWGRVAASVRAAESEVAASRNDLDSMAVSLAAEVAETWFSIIEQQAILDLVQKQTEVSQTYLKLIQLRFAQGMVSALDVYQQRQQVAGTRAQTPLIESRIKVLQHKLSVLLGQPPQTRPDVLESLGFSRSLPELPALPATGLPADVLKKRPDVRAAYLRVNAADHRVGAAIAEHFPSLRLNGSAGFRASEFTRILENLIWDIIGNLSTSLWKGDSTSAEVRRTRALLEERTANYVQTALKAFQEVEDALVREEHQRIYLEKLKAQIGFARKSLEESRARYLNGSDDYLRVLTSLKSLQTLEQSLISAKKQRLSHRIQLYRALGGKFET